MRMEANSVQSDERWSLMCDMASAMGVDAFFLLGVSVAGSCAEGSNLARFDDMLVSVAVPFLLCNCCC